MLLVEALTAAALLAMGVGVVSNAFSSVRDAFQRSERQTLLAECATRKIFEDVTGPSVSGGCEEKFVWTRREEAVSPRLRKITWQAHWQENGKTHEEIFETLR